MKLVVATLLGTLGAAYFFVAPRFSLDLYDPDAPPAPNKTRGTAFVLTLPKVCGKGSLNGAAHRE